MNGSQLVDEIVSTSPHSVPKVVAQDVVMGVFDIMADALASGEDVVIKGFGTFRSTATAARKGRNPKTGEMIDIPASRRVRFKPSKVLRDEVKGNA